MILEGVHTGSQSPIYYAKTKLSKTPHVEYETDYGGTYRPSTGGECWKILERAVQETCPGGLGHTDSFCNENVRGRYSFVQRTTALPALFQRRYCATMNVIVIETYFTGTGYGKA